MMVVMITQVPFGHCMTTFSDSTNGTLPDTGGPMASEFIDTVLLTSSMKNWILASLNSHASNAEIFRSSRGGI